MADRRLPRAQDGLAPDRTLTYREWGPPDAPVVVAWPGLNERAPAQFDEAGPAWAERDGLRVLAVSPPGWETPPLSREEYLPTRLAARVLALLDALGLERAAYVGFSWGASIGCHLAALAPERLNALALLDAGYTDFQDRPDFRAQPFDDVVASIRQYGGSVAAEVIAAAGAGVVEEPPSRVLATLGGVSMPILLVVASETLAQEWARRALERFRTAVPAAAVHEVDSGHDVLAGRPEETIEVVGSWLPGR